MMIMKVKIEFTSRKESESRKSFQGGEVLFFDLGNGYMVIFALLVVV